MGAESSKEPLLLEDSVKTLSKLVKHEPSSLNVSQYTILRISDVAKLEKTVASLDALAVAPIHTVVIRGLTDVSVAELHRIVLALCRNVNVRKLSIENCSFPFKTDFRIEAPVEKARFASISIQQGDLPLLSMDWMVKSVLDPTFVKEVFIDLTRCMFPLKHEEKEVLTGMHTILKSCIGLRSCSLSVSTPGEDWIISTLNLASSHLGLQDFSLSVSVNDHLASASIAQAASMLTRTNLNLQRLALWNVTNDGVRVFQALQLRDNASAKKLDQFAASSLVFSDGDRSDSGISDILAIFEGLATVSLSMIRCSFSLRMWQHLFRSLTRAKNVRAVKIGESSYEPDCEEDDFVIPVLAFLDLNPVIASFEIKGLTKSAAKVDSLLSCVHSSNLTLSTLQIEKVRLPAPDVSSSSPLSSSSSSSEGIVCANRTCGLNALWSDVREAPMTQVLVQRIQILELWSKAHRDNVYRQVVDFKPADRFDWLSVEPAQIAHLCTGLAALDTFESRDLEYLWSLLVSLRFARALGSPLASLAVADIPVVVMRRFPQDVSRQLIAQLVFFFATGWMFIPTKNVGSFEGTMVSLFPECKLEYVTRTVSVSNSVASEDPNGDSQVSEIEYTLIVDPKQQDEMLALRTESPEAVWLAFLNACAAASDCTSPTIQVVNASSTRKQDAVACIPFSLGMTVHMFRFLFLNQFSSSPAVNRTRGGSVGGASDVDPGLEVYECPSSSCAVSVLDYLVFGSTLTEGNLNYYAATLPVLHSLGLVWNIVNADGVIAEQLSGMMSEDYVRSKKTLEFQSLFETTSEIAMPFTSSTMQDLSDRFSALEVPKTSLGLCNCFPTKSRQADD
eukprot:ANDGO_07923.mRNA.1 hypothetical protein